MPTSISKLYRNTFTCPLLSYILQKHMSPCPLPSLHSTESLIHMPAYINVLKRSTHSRAHCQKCTPQKHTLTGTMHTALYRITYSHAHCYPALYRNTCTCQHPSSAVQKHILTCLKPSLHSTKRHIPLCTSNVHFKDIHSHRPVL